MNKLPTPGDWHNRKMGVPLCSPRHCMSGFVACFVVAHGVVVSLWWSSYNTNNHVVVSGQLSSLCGSEKRREVRARERVQWPTATETHTDHKEE